MGDRVVTEPGDVLDRARRGQLDGTQRLAIVRERAEAGGSAVDVSTQSRSSVTAKPSIVSAECGTTTVASATVAPGAIESLGIRPCGASFVDSRKIAPRPKAASTTWSAASATGQQLIVFHLADGKATEAWIVAVDQAAADAFWD